jgi:OOP family OmpA-OmpF porin
MKITGHILVLLLLSMTTKAQNLVINPSFEEMEYCPNDFTQQNLKSLKKWTQAGEGTPDHFNTCSKKVGVPNNMFGQQHARTGNGYAGLGTYLNNHNRYREYLLGNLSRALKPGEQVCITIYYSAADNCQFIHDGFGVSLSAQPHKTITSKPIILQ